MSNAISYNSWEDKAPFGALQVNNKVRISVSANEEHNLQNIAWIILKDDKEVGRVNLLKENKKYYQGEFDGFKEEGLYFYYFEVDVDVHGNTQKLFYGKRKEDATSCEYQYDNLNKYQITVYKEFNVPKWYKEGIMYNIFVDKFNNGNRNGKPNDPKPNSFIYGNWSDTPMYIKDENGDIARWDFHGGNLKGITDKIGYLSKLGISIIYLSPIFESRSNHKYDTADYKNIDSMFGDEQDLQDLIEKASKKDISIILDGVFSHTGADSKYFNRYSKYEEVGAFESEDSKYRSWYKFNGSNEDYDCWWGIKDLPNVNELEPSYMDYIIHDKDSVVNKWTSMGIKGWRLDVADELPTKFIREFRKELKSVDEDSVLVGEVWEDASNKVSYGDTRTYLLGEELDSVMGYPFRDNVLDFLRRNITSTQLGNRFMQMKENYPSDAFKSNLNIISSHDVTRIRTELNEDVDMVKLSVAMQMTFEGIPYIYYGDEAGLSGGKDPDNRRTYPWKNEDEDMMDFYKHSINIRNKNEVLTNGDTRFINTNNNEVFGYVRFNEKNEKILVLINRDDKDHNIELKLDENTLEEIEINNSNKKYLEITTRESDSFNVPIDAKSCKIFNLLTLED